MNRDLQNEVCEMLAAYVDVTPEEFQMEADLDLVYDVDSTEMTDLTKAIEQRFGVSARGSECVDWSTGLKICAFLKSQLETSAASA